MLPVSHSNPEQCPGDLQTTRHLHPMSSSPKKKKGKAKETAKIQTFNDKYARTGTFTSMSSSSSSSSASKTKTSSIHLGYNQPSKKPKLAVQDHPGESIPGSQPKDSGNTKSRSQVSTCTQCYRTTFELCLLRQLPFS